MPSINQNTLKYRIDKLEECYSQLDSKIDKILTNHLPHLSADNVNIRGELQAIKSEVRSWAAVNVGAIVMGIILSKLFL